MVSRFQKVVLVFCSLLALSGCESPDSTLNLENTPISTQEAQESAHESQLLNALDWEIDGDITLDAITKTTANNNGTETVFILHPSKWPSNYLLTSVPEYSGKGYLYALITTGPAMHSEHPETSEVISISIYGYEDTDLATFEDSLLQTGFAIVPKEEYTQDVLDALETNQVDGYSKYDSDNVTVQLIQNHDNLGDFIQITTIQKDRIASRTGK